MCVQFIIEILQMVFVAHQSICVLCKSFVHFNWPNFVPQNCTASYSQHKHCKFYIFKTKRKPATIPAGFSHDIIMEVIVSEKKTHYIVVVHSSTLLPCQLASCSCSVAMVSSFCQAMITVLPFAHNRVDKVSTGGTA